MYEKKRRLSQQRRSMENLKELRTKVQRQLLNQASTVDHSFRYEIAFTDDLAPSKPPLNYRASQLTKSLHSSNVKSLRKLDIDQEITDLIE